MIVEGRPAALAMVVVATVVATACAATDPPIIPATLPTDDSTGEETPDGGDSGTATAPGRGETGDPCAKDADCKGVDATCVLVDDGAVSPGGRCTSTCDDSENDPSGYGHNAGCPGTKGSCWIDQRCYQLCTERSGAAPCRDGYSCFFTQGATGCKATATSECDSFKAGSCAPLDGGLRVCRRTGLDPVGRCVPGCDLFTQDCSAGSACYATLVGEGMCVPIDRPGNDGDPCSSPAQCDRGLTCAPTSLCRPYCGGSNDVPCTNGHTCVDYDTDVPATVLGLCDG